MHCAKHFIYIYINPHDINVITHIFNLKKLEIGTCSWTHAIFKFPSSLSYPALFSIIFSLALSPLSFHIIMTRLSIMNGSPLLPNGKSCDQTRLTKLFSYIWNGDNKRQHSILYLAYNTQCMCGTAMAIFLALRGNCMNTEINTLRKVEPKYVERNRTLLNLFELLEWAVTEMNLTPDRYMN